MTYISGVGLFGGSYKPVFSGSGGGTFPCKMLYGWLPGGIETELKIGGFYIAPTGCEPRKV